MKTISKRLLSWLVVLVMVLSMIPAQPIHVHAAETTGNVLTVGAEDAVYTTLQAALDQAAAGDTVQLVTDLTVTTSTDFKKNITVDLNGHKLTLSGSGRMDFDSKAGINVVFKDSSKAVAADGTITYGGVLELAAGSSAGGYFYITKANVKVTFDGMQIANNGVLTMPSFYSSTNATGAVVSFVNGALVNFDGYYHNEASQKKTVCFDFDRTVPVKVIVEDSTIVYAETSADGAVMEGCNFQTKNATFTFGSIYRGMLACCGVIEDTQFNVASIYTDLVKDVETRAYYFVGDTTVGLTSNTKATDYIEFYTEPSVTASKLTVTDTLEARVVAEDGTTSYYTTLAAAEAAAKAGSKIVIVGGTYDVIPVIKGVEVVINGGTFRVDPTDNLAPGYDAVKNDDNTWTVRKANYVAQVGETKYESLQEAIKAAAPNGTVEIINDVVVDKWIMFAETLSIGNGNLITLNINGLTINGNHHTLTVKSIESAGNGNRLFYDAQNLNINDLTINYTDSAANQGGIGLTSGTIKNVEFIGGGYGVLPGAGAVTIEGCNFKTNSTAIYYETARDNLVVTGNTFELADNVNVILLRGATKFTNNTVTSGRTVNVVSGSPVVTGNDFGDVRFKVYNTATAEISGNEINDLEFSDTTKPGSTFTDNTLGDDAQAALDAVMPAPVAKIGNTEYASFEAALAAAVADPTITRIDILCDCTQTTFENTEEPYWLGENQNLVIGADEAVTVTLSRVAGETISIYQNAGSSLTIEKNVTIEGLDIIANGFATTGENTTIDGDLKAMSLKQWTSNGTITVSETGSVWLGYGDGQFDLAYGNGTVTVNGTGDKTVAQFKAGYSGTRGNGNTLNLNDTYFEAGAWFNLNGSNGTINANNALLKVSGGDASGKLVMASSGNVINLTNGSELVVATLTIGSGNTVKLSAGNKITATTISGAGKIVIDATGMTAGEVAIITGDASGFTGEIEVTGANMEAEIVNGKIVLTAKSAAQIGDTYYATLADAIAAAQAGETVTLLTDITLTEGVTVPAGKEITLDLNGKTISQTKAQTEGYQMILNDGNLTIKDSATGGKISYTDSGNGGEYVSNTITNRGTLTVESGTIENLSSATVAQNGYPYAIDTSIWGAATEVNTIISGGTVTCAKYSALRLCANSETEPVNVTISGGTINGRIEVQNPTSNKATKGTLTITGGTINKNASSKAIMIFGGGGTAENLKVAISGGTFTGAIGYSTNFPIKNFDENVITGGTFDTNVSDYCVTGYTCEANDDGTYGVVEFTDLKGTGTEADPYLINNLADLKLFRDIVNAGSTYKNEYIQLTADIDLAGEAWTPIGNKKAPFKGNFDGGEKTISNLAVTGGANMGFFGYVTEAKINNLTINNATVTGTDCVGAVVGQGYASTYIDNCHVSGSIKIEGQTNVGGIVGKYYARVTNSSVIGDGVANSYVKGTYTAANLEGDNIGGIMGHAGENNTHSGNTVKNITVSGTRKIGGLIGTTDRATDISGCTVENVVVVSTATADYVAANTATATIGGLIGNYYGGSTGGTVTDNTIKDVTFELGNALNAGAIVGGNRTTPNEAPTGVTVSSVVASNITGATNNYLFAAEVGGAYYTTLQAAIDAASEGDTITVIADIELTAGVTVPAGKTITLDLNGKTVSMSVAATKTSALITNNGTLTIKDSVGNGKLTYVSSTVSTTYSTSTIINNGTLTVESGTIENTSARGGAPYAIDNYNTLTVNGGTITATSTTAIRQVQNGSNDNTVTVTGGTISGGYAGMQVYVFSNAKKTTTKITGGTFKSTYAFYTTFYNLTDSSNTKIEVSGGTFDGAVFLDNLNKGSTNLNVSITDGTFLGWTYVYTTDANGNAVSVKSITGGTFANDVSDYCAEGYAALPTLNDTFVVGEKPSATVNNLGAITVPAGGYMVYGNGDNTTDMPLSFVMQFLADQTEEDMADSPFADWYGDFVITFTGIENGESFTADGCYLAGHYGDFGWVKVPVDGMVIEEGTRYPVMLGVGMGQKYEYICSSVQDFKCAMYLDPAILAANPNLKVTLELGIVDNSNGSDAAANALINNEAVYSVTDYDYDAEDFLPDVAQIGTTKFKTLADALVAAQAGDTITLLADITLTEGVTVPAGKTITLDLNGNTVSMSVAATEASALITNNGNLTIKDSGTDGKLTYVSSTVSTAYSTSTIINNGTLTVESGIIENTSERGSGSAAYAIDSYNTLTVNGGVITTTNTIAIRQAQFGNYDNSVTVTGGTISGGLAGMQVNVFSTAKKNTTVIEGGEFEGEYAFYTTFKNVLDSSNTEIEVSGGTFDGNVYLYNGNKGSTNLNVSISDGTFQGETYVYTKDADGNMVSVKSITGGAFANDVNEYCAPGYKCVTEDNVIWTVQVNEDVVAWNINTGDEYETVYEALMAANNTTDTIQMLADSSEMMVMVPAGVTLDLNGKTLTVSMISSFGSIVDSQNGEGFLKVAKGSAMLSVNNAQTPVYNVYGYYFTTFDLSAGSTCETDSGMQFWFKPAADEKTTQLLADGAADNDLIFKVRVSWDDSQAGTGFFDVTFDDSNVQEVFTNSISWFFVTLKNYSDYESVTFSVLISTESARVDTLGSPVSAE